MPDMSVCRDCGDPILWVDSQHGRRLPPLQRMGKMVTVLIEDEDGTFGYVGPGYEKHHCDENKVRALTRRREEEERQRERQREQWTEEREARRENSRQRRERKSEIDAAAELFRTETLRLTQIYSCPKCGVEAGETCENLTERRKGNNVPTRTPHQDRINLIPKSKRPYWKDQFTVIVP